MKFDNCRYCRFVDINNNEKRDWDDWGKLTDEQKQGNEDAMDEIDTGKGIAHEKVMENIRKIFTNV